MKIVYCLAGTCNPGGMERIVINKANWLADHGYDITIVTTEQAGRHDFFAMRENINRTDLNIMYSDTNSYGVVKKFIARRKLIHKHKVALEEVLKSIKPDIVVSTFGNEVGFLPSINDGSRKIAEIHFSRWYRMQLNRSGIWKLIDKYLTFTDYRALRKYDRFICLTNEDSENWKGIENVTIIPNFVDKSASSMACLDSKSMIAVGRLHYQKGYDRLINAWKIVAEKYPDWILNIFGEGGLKDALMEHIAALGLRNKIQIHAPTKDIVNEYLKNSAFLLSSRYEGLPMVMLEAMSVGLPLISFSCKCGPKDVITNGYNGFLVNDGDIEGLADSIVKLIEDPSLRKKIGENSYERSSAFEKERIMKKWDKLFHSMVDIQ